MYGSKTQLCTEQDSLHGEKLKEDYYRDAVQYLNTSNKLVVESGENPGTFLFLTRGG
jgi:hypothetical protein